MGKFGSGAGGLIVKHAKQRVSQLYTADKGGTRIYTTPGLQDLADAIGGLDNF